MKAATIEKRLRSNILDIMSYFAVYERPLSTSEILYFLPVKATFVAVQTHLDRLEKARKVIKRKDGLYELKKVDYKNFESNRKNQKRLLETARKTARLIIKVPGVKAVVVCDSVAFGNCSKNSNINLIVVTVPTRLYICKAIIFSSLRRLNKRAVEKDQAGKFTLNRFYTTAGLRFVNAEGPELHRTLWFASATALYGKAVWENLLYRNKYLNEHLPNYPWKHQQMQVHTPLINQFEYFDDLGYRRHLKHVAAEKRYRKEGALLRIRPDVIIQAANHGNYLQPKLEQYERIRSMA